MFRSCLVVAACACALCPHSLRAGSFEVSSRSEMLATMIEFRARQFLQHATFGATEAEVRALTKRMLQLGVVKGAEEWIDNQFTLPVTYHTSLAMQMVEADGFSNTQTGINVNRYRYHAWWHNAITAEDQLRQRMAWALIQICTIGVSGNNFNNADADRTGVGRWLGMSNYYDMLLDNSFKTYRDVIGDVTFHPIMGVWLTHLRNRKANPSRNTFPDENYAREVLQLFTIGLYELNPDGTQKQDANGDPIPTFDNDTIETFARLFTGLTYNQSTNIGSGMVNFQEPMMMFDNEHDKDPKLVFGGTTLPGGTEGVADINAGLDNILAHPNVGPFVCRRLIQRFVRSNPSKSYLSRVVAKFDDNGQGVRGDLKAVIKAILLDKEAWDGIAVFRQSSPLRVTVVGQGTERSRLQEPVVAYASFVRRYGSTDYINGWFMLDSNSYHFSQFPYGSPSVFNFYLPDYQPAGDITEYVGSSNIPDGSIFAPEFQLLDAVYANRIPNRFRSDVVNENRVFTLLNNSNGVKTCTITYDFSTERDLAEDPAALAAYLDRTLCCGTMTNDARQKLVEALSIGTNIRNRYRAAIMSVLTSPAFAVSE